MQPFIFRTETLHGCPDGIGNLCGGSGALLLERKEDAVIAVDFGVHFAAVIGHFHIRHILKCDVSQISRIHMEQYQLFQLFLRTESVAHADGILGLPFGKIARRHGEVLGSQQSGNGISGNHAVQSGLFIGLVPGHFEFFPAFFQLVFLGGQGYGSLSHFLGQCLNTHIQLFFGFVQLFLLDGNGLSQLGKLIDRRLDGIHPFIQTGFQLVQLRQVRLIFQQLHGLIHAVFGAAQRRLHIGNRLCQLRLCQLSGQCLQAVRSSAKAAGHRTEGIHINGIFHRGHTGLNLIHHVREIIFSALQRIVQVIEGRGILRQQRKHQIQLVQGRGKLQILFRQGFQLLLLLVFQLAAGFFQRCFSLVQLFLRFRQSLIHRCQHFVIEGLNFLIVQRHPKTVFHQTGGCDAGNTADALKFRHHGFLHQLGDFPAVLPLHVHAGHHDRQHIRVDFHNHGRAHCVVQLAFYQIQTAAHFNHGAVHVGVLGKLQNHHTGIGAGNTDNLLHAAGSSKGLFNGLGHGQLHFLRACAGISGDDRRVGQRHFGQQIR